MIVAFFESIKHTGHLFPIALLRVYMGYFYLSEAIHRYTGDFLNTPTLADWANQGLNVGGMPPWYAEFLQTSLIPHWQIYAHAIVIIEFIIGISFLLGYVVRPAALLAVFLSLNFLAFAVGPEVALHKTFIAINFTLAWLGAGRCLGFDYYFYKSHRGIWW